jgi:tetratricopeptide (TPR) repeat protein
MSDSSATVAPAPAQDPVLRYRAFLSYSHTDTRWSTWLLRRLETYRVPERFQGRAGPIGVVGGRIAPVFRDRDELPTADNLSEAVQGALQQSATLIVVCSPAAARSRWVNEEVIQFKRLRQGGQVFALIVAGEPNAADPTEECFPPALRFAVGTSGVLPDHPLELIAADARAHADGRENAFIRLVAGLLGVGFDDLRQREQQRRQRRRWWIAAGTATGLTLTIALSTLAILARNDARRRQDQGEALVALMLADMETRIQQSDRLDVLDEVAEKVMTYFKTLNPRDLTDAILTQHAKALTHIGVIRTKQKRLIEAQTAFTGAFERIAVLTQRHPTNGQMLFERAQAEFGIGDIHQRRGQLDAAGEWFLRYRDSTTKLTALAPSNILWEREAVSGMHNLAVVELKRGQLSASAGTFTRALALLQDIARRRPEDRQLEHSIANTVSFLGTVAERAGHLLEAHARYGEQIRRLEALVKGDPSNPRWQERLANALALQSTIDEITGQTTAALEKRIRARELVAPLVAKDPSNGSWLLTLLKIETRKAALLGTRGDDAGARQVLDESKARLAKLSPEAAAERDVQNVQIGLWRLEAEQRAAARLPDALAAATKAVAIGEERWARDQPNVEALTEHLRGCIVAGNIAARLGDAGTARRHWERAVELAGPSVKNSRHWALLEPVARALARLGRTAESRELTDRLHALGFVPLEPWPAPIGDPPLPGTTKT